MKLFENSKYGDWWQERLECAQFRASMDGKCEHTLQAVNAQDGIHCIVCGSELFLEDLPPGTYGRQFARRRP